MSRAISSRNTRFLRIEGVPRRAIALLLGCLAAVGACNYGHQEGQSSVYRPLVFPGEARLGASAFMVIDSNQFMIGDELERYDLHRDRVKILVEGNIGTAEADLRSVFTIETGRATDDAELRRNTWATIAFFDLPDESDNISSAPYPRHAVLHLQIDNEDVPELESVIWLIGEGGSPTSLDATPLLPILEQELEPQTTVRLRARGDGSKGFLPSWTIAGVETEIRYDPDCLASPSAHVGSDAIGGGVTMGPATPVSGSSPPRNAVRVVLTHPRGFQLAVASAADATRLGTGPILDFTFDRAADPECSEPLSGYFEVRALKVHDRNGTLRVSRPFPKEGDEAFDGSDFFDFYYVDPDRP
jgi:hypothetical protein